MRHAMKTFLWLRYAIRPDVRNWLDGLGALFAITLFFALIQAAHDGIANRNHQFDPQRWWYPIIKMIRE